MKIALEKVEPAQIEKRSFEIIGEELGERSFPKLHEPIIKRCTTQVQILITQTTWSSQSMRWKQLSLR